MKQLLVFNANFQNSFQDVVYYRILGCDTNNGRTLNIKQNWKEMVSFL